MNSENLYKNQIFENEGIEDCAESLQNLVQFYSLLIDIDNKIKEKK